MQISSVRRDNRHLPVPVYVKNGFLYRGFLDMANLYTKKIKFFER